MPAHVHHANDVLLWFILVATVIVLLGLHFGRGRGEHKELK